MKPIEPGCLVLVVRTGPENRHYIGKTFLVEFDATGLNPWDCKLCAYKGGSIWWALNHHDDDGGQLVCCACSLIRIDDDPDAVTEPEQREVEA